MAVKQERNVTREGMFGRERIDRMYFVYFIMSLSGAIPSFEIRYSTFCGSAFRSMVSFGFI